MKATIFYSWQSDIRPGAACRGLIQQALEDAASKIAKDQAVGVVPVIDRDTQDVPGCPDIGATIFSKIDAADVFVADVTIINDGAGPRPTPNPNVLIELGYALKSLGEHRIVLVQNTAWGGPELLPFDLRQKRTLTFASPAAAAERAPERRALEGKLEAAVRAVLKDGTKSSAAVDVGLTYERKSITQELHQYELVATIRNSGTRRLEDWEIEIEMPTELLEPGISVGIKVPERSNNERSLFRAGSHTLKVPLRSGDERTIKIGYRVNGFIFHKRGTLFAEPVKVRAFVDGALTAEVVRPVAELQCF